MPLVPDNSIPFPQDAPDVWDTLRLRGASGQTYEWPGEFRLLGQVTITLEPPELRTKESTKAAAKKPRVKKIGEGNCKLQLKFEVTRKGWPTFVALWRMLSESLDAPWRVLHPEVDTFDVAAFILSKNIKIESKTRGIVIASGELGEIDPETQAGKGASAGVLSPGAIAYNLEAEAYARMRAEQLAIQQSQENAVRLAKEADAARKPGVLVAKRMPVDKAAAFGKIKL